MIEPTTPPVQELDQTVINSEGAKQSAITGAWHLLDSELLIKGYRLSIWESSLISNLLSFRKHEPFQTEDIIQVLLARGDLFQIVATVLEHGATKYPEDNWRAISVDDHVNHAIRHFCLWLYHAKEVDYNHFICRAYMAVCVALRPNYRGCF